MRSIDSSFYKSKAWRNTRDVFLRLHPFCEECLNHNRYTPAVHVHHRTWLNEQNVNNPEIALDFNNLEALCIECHNKEHFKKKDKRYEVDENGHVITINK